jgi:microcystin-dependent protein
MSEPYVGEIRMFAGNFPPVGWMFCDGQVLPIDHYEVLFDLIGTTYGGDGQTTFALPDLRGRVPLHWGQSPGTSSYVLGQSGGAESVALNPQQLPSHAHALSASTQPAGAAHDATDALGSSTKASYYGGGTPNVPMDSQAFSTSGGGQPHSNVAPFVALNYIIALFGIFPSQS